MEQNKIKNETDPQTEPHIEPPAAHSATANTAEVIPSPEEMLKEAERKAQEHYDAWMYAKAESENIRRRGVEDVSKAHKFAVERFSNEMLAVKDSLEAGLAMETSRAVWN
jgi:molecular chaperone GrpE